MHVSNNAGVVIGHTAQVVAGVQGELQVLGAGGDDSGVVIGRFEAGAGHPTLSMVHARGAIGTFTATIDQDFFGGIEFRGAHTGNAVSPVAAFIKGQQNGAGSSSRVPGMLIFGTGDENNTATEKARLDENGSLFLGDTANGNMTQGLTINQGAADNQIFALRSSDVATGLVDITKGASSHHTTDFFTLQKFSGAVGGAYMHALADAGAYGMIQETWSKAPTTDNSSASIAQTAYFGGQHDGANADVDMAGNSNLFS